MRRLATVLAAAAALCACGPQPTAKPAPRACLAPTTAQPAPATAGMALIRGGRFEMGAAPLHAEEGPPRTTRVGDFWIDRTEVTNADFARFVAATGYVTEAERPLDPKAYPGLSAYDLYRNAEIRKGLETPGLAGDALHRWLALI